MDVPTLQYLYDMRRITQEQFLKELARFLDPPIVVTAAGAQYVQLRTDAYFREPGRRERAQMRILDQPFIGPHARKVNL